LTAIASDASPRVLPRAWRKKMEKANPTYCSECGHVHLPTDVGYLVRVADLEKASRTDPLWLGWVETLKIGIEDWEEWDA
jgi:hypothetical protein